MSELLFYDAPTSPAGIFDHFLVIPSFESDIGTLCYTNQVAAIQAVLSLILIRAVFNTIFVTDYRLEFLEAITNKTFPSAYPDFRNRAVLPLNLYSGWTASSAY